jgi:hypothetical protein
MTALITAGGTAGTGNTAVTEKTQVICSGTFSGGSVVVIEVEADTLRKAVVHIFNKPDAVAIDAKTGTTITATIKGGNSDTSIDVSAI